MHCAVHWLPKACPASTRRSNGRSTLKWTSGTYCTPLSTAGGHDGCTNLLFFFHLVDFATNFSHLYGVEKESRDACWTSEDLVALFPVACQACRYCNSKILCRRNPKCSRCRAKLQVEHGCQPATALSYPPPPQSKMFHSPSRISLEAQSLSAITPTNVMVGERLKS